ncbi:LysM peptidoglycan-binding domain-containing protein [Paenibacillus sp. GP183]|uniref:LysM peptidoglycan-binding domain-containing protein n=1 Tax=Paenibacillus sp. GP183 TaxID=1882751 RepID=UPI000899428A|nr:LysM peptidoglycan-binding domain-containing protein [Paenibacillus sp. GP183]SEB59610.1 LysM domain-containing protein [Paenibacillus sp. GP183]
MYIAYSNSYDGNVSSKLKSAHRTEAAVKGPNKSLHFFIALVVLTFVFSFGAFVQAYAANTASTHTNNLKISSGSYYDNHSASNPSPAAKKIIVNSGDTLWNIASTHASNGQNVRSYIENIKKLNGLTSSSVNAGDVLILP